jgi:hypothetical protein
MVLNPLKYSPVRMHLPRYSRLRLDRVPQTDSARLLAWGRLYVFHGQELRGDDRVGVWLF